MIEYKALYEVMQDDLKDAEELACYAMQIREKGNDALADTFIKNADFRLKHFLEFYSLMEEEMKETEEKEKGSVSLYLVHETWEALKRWEDRIRKQVEKY